MQLVWGQVETVQAHIKDSLQVYAERYDVEEGAVSLPQYLDAHGSELRSAYIAFIHELSLQKVQGRSLAEVLSDREGFSYWWMTQLAEKSPFKSPRIHDCLRLMALEMLLKEKAGDARRLVLVGGDKALALTLESFCSRSGLVFKYDPTDAPERKGTLSRIHRLLPWRVKGFLSLRHWLRRWILRGLANPAWFAQPKGVLFCSYFFNLDGRKLKEGNFHSHQWENLPATLQREGWQLNWLHHMLLLPGVRSVREALSNAAGFNAQSHAQGCHSFVEAQLGGRLLVGALLEWLILGRRVSRIRTSLSFTPKGSQLDLWPMLEEDWETSLRGAIGLGNCIWRRLFDRALSSMPPQAACIYLWENQGWEAALVHAWRRHQHTPVIGFPHATTAFWHLNNFDDPVLFAAGSETISKPIPDRLAVSGPSAWSMFCESGYPPTRMMPVEAVRFQHLLDRPVSFQTRRRDPEQPLRMLMLGDFSRKQSQAMGTCLASAARQWSGKMKITVKPHPITSLDVKDLPNLSFNLTFEPLGEILQAYDVVFASNSSSAALDAWLYGLPLAVFLDDCSLNHSPMRGALGACFVSNAKQLAQFLEQEIAHKPMSVDTFFWLDENLKQWRQLMLDVTDQVQTEKNNR